MGMPQPVLLTLRLDSINVHASTTQLGISVSSAENFTMMYPGREQMGMSHSSANVRQTCFRGVYIPPLFKATPPHVQIHHNVFDVL